MIIPTDKVVFDGPTATYWFDDEGILNIVSKSVPRTAELIEANGEFLNSLLMGTKVCCLYDITVSSPLDEKSRALIKAQVVNLYTAVAMITTNPVSQMMGTVISLLMPHDVPSKLFSDHGEARQWLRQFVN